MTLKSRPPPLKHFLLSFPQTRVLLVTINRPEKRNSLPAEASWEAHGLFNWFDSEPSLLVAVVTGAGDKAFCAGKDLKEQNSVEGEELTALERAIFTHPPTGFMGLSQRKGIKPVLAAVNGFALGGGFEISLNCDIVVASSTAEFGLPEAGLGRYAAAGGLPRLIRTCGMQIASELAMTCRRLSAQEALSLRLINKISQTPASVVEECLAIAAQIASLPFDAIIMTRQGLREAWEVGSVQYATSRISEQFASQVRAGENSKIGLDAFVRKVKPQWGPL
ncbi:hypothetical protein BTUL_0343g00010 [Botrytis tulipae]|uniref:Enoyl-CoA hydratase n=1 Tax=Botrytis tulipae TaxID=87230 RepID=A0A4Z1E8G3_9HELO|nr:hypothetical protein BTUL_0343g00010 [Botrytis tulipae]